MFFEITYIFIGIILCFFGFGLHKLVIALMGLGCGSTLGFLVSLFLDLQYGIEQIHYIMIIGLGAILGVILSFFIYKMLIFLSMLAISFIITYFFVLSATNGESNIALIVAGIISLFVAIICIKLHDIAFIVVTALIGGMSISIGIAPLIIKTNIPNNIPYNLYQYAPKESLESLVSLTILLNMGLESLNMGLGSLKIIIIAIVMACLGVIVQTKLFLKKKQEKNNETATD